MKSFVDRVAVVTGAGSGIGRETSEMLARRGCHVALVDINPDALVEASRPVESLGRMASTHCVDVSDADQMAVLPEEVLAVHGGCNILVNNAGVTSAGAFAGESLDDLRWIVGINVWGVVYGCRAFLPALREAKEAHVVNMSSMVGLLGLPFNASYALTKGAVRSFTEALRAELITTAVGVTAVFPGAIRTNITNTARGSASERLARMGRSRFAPVAMRPPRAVARRIVSAIEHDRARVIVGPDARVVDLMSRLVPGRSGIVGRLTSRLERS